METKTLKELEKDHIQYVLDQTSWDLEKTAGLLKISLSLLKRKIKEHGLKPLDDIESHSNHQ
jgi:DNA-binding NtrC family response regulator